jgi:hypothetical protein
MHQRLPLRIALAALGVLLAGAAQAQSACASDGQPRPVALLERFLDADCGDCWRAAGSPRAGPRDAVLDWVLPGGRGEDAPLSAVASRDGLKRLSALGLAAPATASSHSRPVAPQGRLRVAHGLPVAGYIGASVALQRPPAADTAGPWTAWLVLVETVPAGTEGSPVPRNLVRNTVQRLWDGHSQLSKSERSRWLESRVLDIPPGTDTGRLSVVGWVEDARGHVFAAAQSRCAPSR